MMGFDATVGGADANSYVTLEAVTGYMALRINASAWNGLTEAQQEAYAVTATLMLECSADWYGLPDSEEQSLHFPVTDETIIPDAVQRAVCEQIIYLMSVDSTTLPTAIQKGLSSVNAGPVSLVFDRSMIPNLFGRMVRRIIEAYGELAEADDVGGCRVNDLLRG
jgi:hypothetical protein